MPTKYNYMTEVEMNNLAYYKGVDFEDNEQFNAFLVSNNYMPVYVKELDQNIYVFEEEN